MKAVVIDIDTSTGTRRIVPPGPVTVKRGERMAWICEELDIDILFDAGHNPFNPTHPYESNGHVQGKAGDFHTRRVRPASMGTPIPDNTRYKYNIKVLDQGGNVVDHLDPDVIVQGDK